MTAIGNDLGYQVLFVSKVQVHGRAGNVLIAISTSGNSSSILNAVAAAKAIGIGVIGSTWHSGAS